jgi:GAF domain-containing protein
LAALHETLLLDTPPEESFDRLTRLASHLLGVGAALLSLVDKDRQFFKSQVGLPQPWASTRQTRLSHSFCQWVVSSREQLIVEDANEHPALRANLAAKDLGVIAYAGVPVKARGGQVLGSFCAIHSEARAWSDEDVETLHDLSRVSEAYTLLDRAKRGADAPVSYAQANPEILIQVAGNALTSAARILSRYGTRMGDADRTDLLAIILEQERHLARLVPDPYNLLAP